jgi:tetratricopeptide (TPR) repeat protein
MPPDLPLAELIDRAVSQYEARAYEAAAADFEAVLRLQPTHLGAMRLLGLSRIRTGDVAAGMQVLERAREAAPRNPAVLMAYAMGVQAGGSPGEAAKLFRLCAAMLPSDAAPQLNLAVALIALGDAMGALAAARRARLRAPDMPEVHYTLGLAELARGELERAAEAMTIATRLRPQFADAWVNLGLVRYRQGNLVAAWQATRQALEVAPEHKLALGNMALFRAVVQQSETPLAELVARDPGNMEARFNLAVGLAGEGREAEALAILAEGEPSDPELAVRWRLRQSAILLQLGRAAEAEDVLQRIEGESASVAPLMEYRQVQLALLRGETQAARQHAEEMQRLLAVAPSLISDRWVTTWFDLAQFWRTQQEPERDFQACAAGHRLLRRNQPFDRAAAAAFFEAIRTGFSRERLAAVQRIGDHDPAPVFVVGMPRSGTTLAEQILAAHPSVHGAGERNAVLSCFAALGGNPQTADAVRRVVALDDVALGQAGARYRQALHALAPAAARVIDKMPGNFRFLGFAALLLPGARFIFCDRDPRDIGLSIFQHVFFGYHPYAHDLADLGWYIAQSRQMMAHWQSVLPERVLVLKLRDWVEEFDATLRRVLAFLDLPYDAACEQFHTQERRVLTVSRQQVRQPINREGLNRWQPYEDFLQPMIAELHL